MIRSETRGWARRLRRILADEQGDEGVNKILIIALIAIPIVIVLLVFGRDIVEWFRDKWGELTGEKDEEGFDPTPDTGG